MNEQQPQDHTLLILCAAVFIFNSPLTSWWSQLSLPWYAMFIPWAVVILMVAINQWRGDTHGD